MGFDVGDTLRALLSIKIKNRHDSYSDQVLRIIVTKIFILCSVFISIDWFQNEVNCIPPKNNILPDKFINHACWVRGFYVYPALSNHIPKSAYYGIPNEMKHDGYLPGDVTHLCEVNPKPEVLQRRKMTPCLPMVKEYYTQYQWMPFVVSFMGFLFYFPYMVFRIANTDIISLKWNLKNSHEITHEDVVHSYFNRCVNSRKRNRVRLLANYLVKLLYMSNSVFGFFFLDWIMNFRFKFYGTEWFKWANSDSSEKFDFRSRKEPSPGNRFLPTFAMCYLSDVRLDSTHSYGNFVVVVCELSSHILYQYAFVVFWVVLIFSMITSLVGFILYIGNHVYLLYNMKGKKVVKPFYKYMTLRELEYLDFIRQRDLVMYDRITVMLTENVTRKRSGNEESIPLTFKPKRNLDNEPRPMLRHLDSIVSMDS